MKFSDLDYKMKKGPMTYRKKKKSRPRNAPPEEGVRLLKHQGSIEEINEEKENNDVNAEPIVTTEEEVFRPARPKPGFVLD
jgi:hypothetical protein